LLNIGEGDYQLDTGSPCIDAGTNQVWMTGAKDLAGNDRVLKGGTRLIVDMGAYEAVVPRQATVIVVR
jgi:hypothetical protein